MEHRRHLVPGQQRRLSFRSFGIVAHVEDDRQLLVAAALFGEAVHPCPTPLGRPAEIVAAEQGFRLAILVKHLEGLHVGMVKRDVLALFEGQSIHAVGGIEHTIDEHAVHIEIRFHLLVTHIQLLFLHLGGVIEPVVWFKFEVRAFGLAGELLNRFGFRICFWRVFRYEVFQKRIHVVRSLRHGVLQRIGGIVGVSHQFSFLRPELRHLADNGVCVVFASAVGAVDGRLIHPAAQIAVVEAGEQRLLGGVHDDNGVWCLASTTFSILAALLQVSR